MSDPLVSESETDRAVSPRAGWYFGVLLVLGVLLASELLVALFFTAFGDRFPFPDPARYRPSEAGIRRAVRVHDAELGWMPRYGTPYGERPRGADRGRPLVAAFGDSFTHGDEVEHHQTWTEQLATLLDGDVFNYGGSGYGMDQAVLRFERDFVQRPTPVVVFAFITHDIQRNVSVYRKFLQPKSDLALTKPRFVLTESSDDAGGGLLLVPNPAPTLEVLQAGMRDDAFLAQIGADDWWYRHRIGLPAKRPPYLRILLHPSFWRTISVRAPEQAMWSMAEPRAIAERLMLRFVREVRTRGARPLIVHLPTLIEMRAYVSGGQEPAALPVLDRLCVEHHVACSVPLRALAGRPASSLASLFVRRGRGGHYSEAGNRWVAEVLAPAITVLLPRASAEPPVDS